MEELYKTKRPLLVAAGAVILVAAAVVGVLTAVKTTPWELTYHIVPSDVSSARIWKGAYTSQLTQDELISVVHLLNKLEKSSFSIKYTPGGQKSAYGLIIQCGDLEMRISQAVNTKGLLVMSFDKTTAKSFNSGQWYIASADLMTSINTLLDARSSEDQNS